jgi:hypothetical protein
MLGTNEVFNPIYEAKLKTSNVTTEIKIKTWIKNLNFKKTDTNNAFLKKAKSLNITIYKACRKYCIFSIYLPINKFYLF